MKRGLFLLAVIGLCTNSCFVLAQETLTANEPLPEVGVTTPTPPPPPPSDIPEQEETKVKVKKDKTLTENIKENAEAIGEKAEDKIVDLPKIGIADALADKIANIEKIKDDKSSLTDMVNDSRKNAAQVGKVKRSNAAVFDISGAMLRMTPEQIDAALTKKGYKKTVQKLDIPNFIRWRNEEKCRAQGVVGYERLENCVAQMAKKDNHQFIERVFYSKYDTQEDMEIRFTSNFTQNKAYYLTYKSNVLRNLRGNSQKEQYLRNIKIYDFWKRINQKYGVPDNKESVIWGLGGNKPYMQAGTGLLRLEDTMLRDLDYTRMSREDKKFMNTGLYNF